MNNIEDFIFAAVVLLFIGLILAIITRAFERGSFVYYYFATCAVLLLAAALFCGIVAIVKSSDK